MSNDKRIMRSFELLDVVFDRRFRIPSDDIDPSGEDASSEMRHEENPACEKVESAGSSTYSDDVNAQGMH